MDTKKWMQDLAAKGPVLLDGAWGTQLQARGLEKGALADFWNINHPERVEEVARAYVNAGSQVILTNTFQSNRIAMSKYPNEENLFDVNRCGVEISRRAAGDQAKVFASMGPSGKLLLTKDVTEEQLASAFQEQAEALAAGGADAIVIETMADIEEAKIAVKAVKRTGLPMVACMVFDSGKNKDRTMMGLTVSQFAEQITELEVDAIGANCGVGIEDAIPICAQLSQATDLPIWIKANAGMPDFIEGEVVYKTTPAQFADFIPELLAKGANFIGGCCGTSPEFISAIRDRL